MIEPGDIPIESIIVSRHKIPNVRLNSLSKFQIVVCDSI